LAIGEFARQAVSLKRILAAGQFPRLSRRLARLGRQHALIEDRFGILRILLEIAAQSLVDDRNDESFNLAVAQLGLGLSLKLRFGHLHAHDRDQPFAHIVTRRARFLDPAGLLGMPVDRARQGRLESAQMRSAFMGVDVVGKALDRVVVAVVVLQRDFNHQPRFGIFLLEVDDRVKRHLAVVEVLHVLDQSLIKLELIALPRSLVLEHELQPLVEIRQLAHPLLQHLVLEFAVRKDL
jgi:hypothetical protein